MQLKKERRYSIFELTDRLGLIDDDGLGPEVGDSLSFSILEDPKAIDQGDGEGDEIPE